MRRIILCVLICMILLINVGCQKNDFKVGEPSNNNIIEKEITLIVKNNTLTNKGATFILKNNSKNEIIYGEPYEIEIKKDGVWHKINVELNFNLPAYTLKSGESTEIEINWEYGYGELVPGNYRIIKNISKLKDDGTPEKTNVSSEFTIK